MQIIIKEGMANGRLLRRAECNEALFDAALRIGTTPDALALAIAMHQPFKPMVLSGAATIEHLRYVRQCALCHDAVRTSPRS